MSTLVHVITHYVIHR